MECVKCDFVGHCVRDGDGRLAFRGLVASPDGKRVLETTRSGSFDPEDAVRLGDDAGQELKKEAGPDFFVNFGN